MLEIKKTFVSDSERSQVDIPTFEKKEQLMEENSLAQFIDENDPEDMLPSVEAKVYYESLLPQ